MFQMKAKGWCILILAIVLFLVVWLMWLPVNYWEFTGMNPDSVYVRSEQGEEYILKFNAENELSLYRYRAAPDGAVSGTRTDYSFSGRYYYYLFLNMYVYPESSFRFWENVLFTGTERHLRARIRMEPKGTYALNCEAEPVHGSTKKEVNILSDQQVVLGPDSYQEAEGDRLKEAQRVIALFDSEGTAVK